MHLTYTPGIIVERKTINSGLAHIEWSIGYVETLIIAHYTIAEQTNHRKRVAVFIIYVCLFGFVCGLSAL